MKNLVEFLLGDQSVLVFVAEVELLADLVQRGLVKPHGHKHQSDFLQHGRLPVDSHGFQVAHLNILFFLLQVLVAHQPDPGVVQNLLATNPLSWVHPEHLEDQVSEQLVQAPPVREAAQSLVDLLFGCQHQFDNFLLARTVKWEKSKRDDKEDDTSGPNIRAVTNLRHDGFVMVSAKDLRCHIVECASDPFHHLPTVPNLKRKAEVDQVQGVDIFCLKQQILKLDVSMHHLVIVQIDKGPNESEKDCIAVLLWQWKTVSVTVLKQVAAGEVPLEINKLWSGI